MPAVNQVDSADEPVGVLIWSPCRGSTPALSRVAATPAASRLAGLPYAEWLGHSLSEHLPAPIAAARGGLFAEVARSAKEQPLPPSILIRIVRERLDRA